MADRWLPAPGCPGYEVSDAGAVRNARTGGAVAQHEGRGGGTAIPMECSYCGCTGHSGDQRYLGKAEDAVDHPKPDEIPGHLL